MLVLSALWTRMCFPPGNVIRRWKWELIMTLRNFTFSFLTGRTLKCKNSTGDDPLQVYWSAVGYTETVNLYFTSNYSYLVGTEL